ncbi:right-handed parallel beta-helix repeat-containing protein [Pedococcus bigeumensis]|uniref:Uncharacterized protein n=1 Tax=Pedococcus bigeumensis TaxID=433644 RepID=A0A502CS42_9MICO|nr:right-handed parallel beta-helix repeat-containing protein [Pedococcus bigeumensis]TPG16047.1 hypothetical protein EAH86_12475 [Pedococcus bigeumensis]
MPNSRNGVDDLGPGRRGVRRRELLAAVVASAWAGAFAYRYVDPGGEEPRTTSPTAPTTATPAGVPETSSVKLDVRSFGATGDGRTDDTDAFRAALAAGLQVRVPAGTYRVSPGPEGSAIPITRASTRLSLEAGASILLDPGDLPGASIISVSAPDVTIEGGTLIGDLAGPQLRDGEWGHGIVVSRGGDRTVLSNVAVVRCWGDGIYLGGGVQDVALLECTADGNRRQGLSIVSAVRPLVSGGRYVNTGKYGRALPGAGIDVEPNPLRGEAVIDATIRDVELSGNTGPGLLVVGLGGRAEVEVERSVMEKNASPGVTVLGRGASLAMSTCTSRSNHTGYLVEDTAGPVRISDCVAERNAAQGYLLKAADTGLIGCTASDNAGSGVEVAVTARATSLTRCTVVGNSVSGTRVAEVEVWAPATRLEKLVVRAGSPARATFGISLRPSSGGTLVIDTDPPVGFPPGHAVSDLRPGTAKG